MLKKSIRSYFWFGTIVRFLQDIRPGAKLGSEADGMLRASLIGLNTFLNELDLQVTKRAATGLISHITRILSHDDSYLATDIETGALNTGMTEVRKTLEAELSLFEAFVVTPKRIDVKRLLDNPETLFAPSIFSRLPEIARFDFSEAGKCIAFERPTSAAFHLLRATESTLRAFYSALVKRGATERMWGPIVSDLRKRRAGKPFTALLNHLDHIRVSFRNPTQHPEKIYDIQEAQELWSLCVDAVSRMGATI